MNILSYILYLGVATIVALAISSRTKRPPLKKGEVYTPPKKNKSKMEKVLIFFGFAVPVSYCLLVLLVVYMYMMMAEGAG